MAHSKSQQINFVCFFNLFQMSGEEAFFVLSVSKSRNTKMPSCVFLRKKQGFAKFLLIKNNMSGLCVTRYILHQSTCFILTTLVQLPTGRVTHRSTPYPRIVARALLRTLPWPGRGGGVTFGRDWGHSDAPAEASVWDQRLTWLSSLRSSCF